MLTRKKLQQNNYRTDVTVGDSVLAPRGFPSGTPVFSSPLKLLFPIPIRSEECPQLLLFAKYIET